MGAFLASLLFENVSLEGYLFVGSIEILYYKCIQKLFNSISQFFGILLIFKFICTTYRVVILPFNITKGHR